MKLPNAIEAYFEADRTMNESLLLAAFAQEAVVRDEGAEHQGIEAIVAWWHAAKNRYHHVAEPLEQSAEGNRVDVRSRVSGQFTGSPALLDFAFTLAGDKIVGLEIG